VHTCSATAAAHRLEQGELHALLFPLFFSSQVCAVNQTSSGTGATARNDLLQTFQPFEDADTVL
jgi:hypothetical protein